MKKIIVIIMAAGFIISSCNNNKNGKDQNSGNREKDDYGKSENAGKIEEKKDDESMNMPEESNTSSMISGWPQVEKDGFMTNCITNAMAGGNISRTVAQNYCDCMLRKMETLYPDIQEAAKLTDADLESEEMKQMAADCLKEN